MNKNLLFIASILFSGITQSLMTAEHVVAQVSKEKKVITSLQFPNTVKIVEKENLLELVEAVFITGYITQVKPLIKAIRKNKPKNIRIIYGTIIDWALENKCDNIENFIKHIPNFTLRRPVKNGEPLGHHIIVQAMYTHNNSLVQYLITKVHSTSLFKKDNTGMSLLEHATHAKNTEASSIISDHLNTLYGPKPLWKIAANLVLWYGILSLLYPGYTITFFPFFICF